MMSETTHNEKANSGPVADITEEARRIIKSANDENLLLRLMGGLAIYLCCPSAQSDPRLQRKYGDMDFVSLSQSGARTKALFSTLGYSGDRAFNNLHGHQRLIFYDEVNKRKIDVFVDTLRMCHNLDFRSRLQLASDTLPLADLLLSKLQIVEINEKDLKDAIALLMDHPISENEGGINGSYIANLTSQDWGLQKTLEINLEKLRVFAQEHDFSPHIQESVDALLALLAKQPKSMKWKARAMVGERVKWYELPEEVE